MLRIELLSLSLILSFFVIYAQPSQALAQESRELSMKCGKDPYDKRSKECILVLYPEGQFDEVIAKIDCRHENKVQTFSCRYGLTSSALEYSCTSLTGEITFLKPLDITLNPDRVCTSLCRGCIGKWKRRKD